MIDSFPILFAGLARHAGNLGVSGRAWAKKAGVRAETLSRLPRRDDCDLNTLTRLAGAVGLEVALRPRVAREMPSSLGRKEEAALLDLCAAGSTDIARWMGFGPRYFMAGLAVLVASRRGADRAALLLLGEALYPGVTSKEEFGRWLEASPVKPSRFLPMLAQRQGARRTRS
jgi:hypothetical protein